MRCTNKSAAPSSLIVPTLRVGMHPVTLRVTQHRDAERPRRHSHAERGNDRQRSHSCPVSGTKPSTSPAAAQ
ncbi:hypothetical protein F7R12_18690 [Pseudomonas tolaasii]|nr:hypothetical protein F7R12_18690 [Pseudomonas tolaasii]